MSRVSVVIPCYNAGGHLAEAVESALAQTHTDLEVVIVDDGSTDAATLALLDAAAWPRTRIVRQANQGPAAARNRAIREATGEFILPLDADDRIDPTYVEKALAVLEARPEIGIVYCRAVKFGSESGPWELPAFTLSELVIDNVIFVSALFRKRDWERVGGFSEHLRHGVEDYDFWVKMVHAGCGVFQLDEPLFHYRVQTVSRTSRFQQESNAVVQTYSDIFRNNIHFFAKHAEVIYSHRFGLYRELDYWRRRYGRVDALYQRSPALQKLYRLLRRLYRALRRVGRSTG